MGEDILSVVFLALIAIVISAIVHQMLPGGLNMPVFVLIAVCLWVMYDYMMLSRYNSKKTCLVKQNKRKTDNLEQQISDLTKQLNKPTEDDLQERELEIQVEQIDQNRQQEIKPEAQHLNEYDIHMYAGDFSEKIKDMHTLMGCTADTRLANRMKYAGMQSQIATENRARWNAEKLRPYFEEEFEEFDNSAWWENDAAFLDKFM
jgi:type III secretory pathway component EscV